MIPPTTAAAELAADPAPDRPTVDLDPALRPDTHTPLTPATRGRFATGFFLFTLLWMVGLFIVSSVLLPQRLTDVAPESKVAASGVLNAVTAIASLLSNVIVGNLSDRTRAALGRRTPWIAAGGVLGGVSLLAMGLLPSVWLIGISYCLSMIGLNMMIAPVVAVLADRIPKSARGTMSAFISAGSLVGQGVGTLIGAHFITQQTTGFIVAGIAMAASGLITVAVWPREASAKELPPLDADLGALLRSFTPPRHARDFYLAFAGRSLLILSYYMILNYQLYILQDFMGQSTEQSAATISTMSIGLLVVSFLSSLTAGPISDRIGRRKIPVVVASFLLAVGYALPWIMKTPLSMVLFAVVGGGLGYAIYGAVDQALNVDVLPEGEDAGKNLGILNIATTLGQMVGPLLTSVIVATTHSYELVFPTAIVLVFLACFFIMRIKSVR